MNNTIPASSASAPVRSLLIWLAGLVGAASLVIAIAIVSVLTLSRDAATLRRELVAALDVPTRAQVQVSAGSGILGAVRLAVAFAKDVPPEAREVLRAVRAASVGVYRLKEEPAPARRAALIDAAEARMNARNWTRVVAVNSGKSTVLVYVPDQVRAGADLRICVGVCSDDQLVIVSAVAESEALRGLALRRGLLARL